MELYTYCVDFVKIKTQYKSHFKLNKTNNNACKNLFVKNMVVFFLFSKIFLKNCTTSIRFLKDTQLQTSLLKAPSRHKQFFHQIKSETFSIQVTYSFEAKRQNPEQLLSANQVLVFFSKLGLYFNQFGSNILTRTKFTISLQIKTPELL